MYVSVSSIFITLVHYTSVGTVFSNLFGVGYINDRYGKSKLLKFVDKIPVVPIGFIRTKNPMFKKRTVNNFTIDGRSEIHKDLQNIDMNILHYMMENVYEGTRIELYNNRIALYSGQNGKCYVTGKNLEIGNIHCHYKKPYHKSRDDSYNNLVLVIGEVHKLIHATITETIDYYKGNLQLDKEQINKINKLRKLLQIPVI